MIYRNIIVAGDIGTGTTTLAKNLAQKLSWGYVASGDIYRQFVLEHNLPLWDHSSFPDEMDKKIDAELLEKIKNEKNIVFDTHYGGWFGRNETAVFRILLTCEPKIASERIMKRSHTHTETLEEIEKRRVGNYEKFHKLYSPEDYQDPKFFHLVIDTTDHTPEETFRIAWEKLND